MLNWGALGEGPPPGQVSTPVRPPTCSGPISPVCTTLLTFHHSVADCSAGSVIAEGLGAHESFFDEMLTDGATLTRAIHYPAMEQAPGEQHVWAGEHADINLITALPRATAAGLQLKTEDGSWADVAPPEGSAIINTGLMLERLSNGLIPSGIHRVVSGEGQQGDRYSVVQFAHPTPWTILSPMPSTVTPDHPLR